MTDLVEIIGSAVQETVDHDGFFGSTTAAVNAVLAAIEKSGHRIVPVRITEEMRQAGLLTDTMDGWDGPETCWEWMLDAAPKVSP